MRFFKISEKDSKSHVAVVFHDYRSGVVICRAKTESFLMSFEKLRNTNLLRPEKETCGDASLVRLSVVPATDYDYASSLISLVSGNFWEVFEDGTCASDEDEMDLVADQFLFADAS